MSTYEEIEIAALALPPEARAMLAEHLLDSLGEQVAHRPAYLVIRQRDTLGIEIGPDFPKDVFIARLRQIRFDNFLCVSLSLRAGEVQLFCSPAAQKLVAAGGCLETRLFIECEFLFKTLFALIEGRHTRLPVAPMGQR